MADPVEICEAVIERLTSALPGWNLMLVEPQPPASLPLPAAVVEIAPGTGADHERVNGDWSEWFVRIVLYASAIDWEASLREMAPLLGTKGPIHTALKDVADEFDDALTSLARGVVRPRRLTDFKLIQKNWAPVRTATIAVMVGAN